MYDQSFNRFSLAREIRAGDFLEHPGLIDPAERLRQVRAAVVTAREGFTGANPLERFHARRKSHYRARGLPEQLVLRRLTRNLRRAVGPQTTNRDQVVRNISRLLAEGTPYCVLRIDIKSFYESIDQTSLQRSLRVLTALNEQSRDLLSSLLLHFNSLGGVGVPRGLAISAPLSEIVLRDFDKAVAEIQGVHFYARYVDDIVIVASDAIPPKPLMEKVSKLLPLGLRLNSSKSGLSVIPSIVSPVKAGGAPPLALCEFDFLGYRFMVHEPNRTRERPGDHERRVDIEIAKGKKRKIKTRMVRAFLQFSIDNRFEDLIDRIRFLSCNFCVRDYRTNKRKLAGIYFGYPQLGGKSSQSLLELNRFLRGVVLGKSSRFSKATPTTLSQKQKRRLLSMCFVRGHSKRTFLRFSTNRIGEIQGCWKDV
jgi:hypothetical protein